MNIHPDTIISLRKSPGYAERAIGWLASWCGVGIPEYEKSLYDCIYSQESLPQWYLALDSHDEIIGGCGLVQNDSMDGTDLSPYLCALFVEENARGRDLGARLLEYARIEGSRLGFSMLYLCTDNAAYFEKNGWKFIGTGNHSWGRTTGIYVAATIRKRALEKMSDFFTERLDMYEDHMLKGDKGGYRKLAELVPVHTAKILDLGCGTGLELDEIFRRMPQVSVVGIDLTQPMLEKLAQKYPERNIRLICGNYFQVDLGEESYDTAISYETLHHFSHAEKVGLYTRIRKALKPCGLYIEADYMVTEQYKEDLLYAENARIRRELNIPPGEFYHFDTPCTVDNQIALFKQAGFSSAGLEFRVDNTTIIVARK
jgi:tRNA (cmo5U34)-methyltransferase